LSALPASAGDVTALAVGEQNAVYPYYPPPPLDENVMVLCNASDHEILANLMTYQLQGPPPPENPFQSAYVRRLVPDPPLDDIRLATVFDGAEKYLGNGLPPLSDSLNGPELGFDPNDGAEVVYTLEDSVTHNWYLARSANSCFQLADECWNQVAYRGSR
jgi:hypothetical protein